MSGNLPVLYDAYGDPIRREVLTAEIAGPTVTGVRTPYSGYPGDGLNPLRLASLLREADAGEPLRFFELAEQIEERDLHYAGVLGTRKRSVAQLDINVEAASDSVEHQKHADMIAAWLLRDELQDELFDMLDAIGKGISYTEIVWETSEGQWQPAKLEWRDPRWFRPDRVDLRTPKLRTEAGDVALPPFKFIIANIKAKSGLPVRGGIARLATWSWMWKAFTQRDWAIFTQTYGQPLRLGKYPVGASDKDQDTLFRAVANIAGDCAAIIPEGMTIEFVQPPNTGSGIALYKDRADWLDQQMSKAVLGQTATTDAIAGGHAVGQEHRQVQEDIERADAKALQAVINRDLARAWVQLEFGPQQLYPRVRIGRAEERNVTQMLDGIKTLVPMGLRVGKSWANDTLGIPEPTPTEELLTAPAAPSPFASSDLDPLLTPRALPPPRERAALNAAVVTDDPIKVLADQTAQLCAEAEDELIGEVRAAIQSSRSFDEVKAKLEAFKPGAGEKNLAGLMRMARVIANLTGRADIADA